jgi:hypothetical protein
VKCGQQVYRKDYKLGESYSATRSMNLDGTLHKCEGPKVKIYTKEEIAQLMEKK